jgi:hypothetical protein
MELVKPGLNVRVVTDVDPTKEIISVRASSIYDITGNTLIIAQTDPPVGPSLINKSVMITYVKDTYAKDDARKHVRYGFPARLAEMIDYNLASGEKVKALRVEKEGDTKPYSIRMFHRVEPSVESGLRLFIGCLEMKILDISLGGVRFCHDGSLKLGPERIENIFLDIGEKTYSLKARICRSWESPDIRSWKEGHFATAEFIAISSNFERILVKKLHQIERNSRPEKEVL